MKKAKAKKKAPQKRPRYVLAVDFINAMLEMRAHIERLEEMMALVTRGLELLGPHLFVRAPVTHFSRPDGSKN